MRGLRTLGLVVRARPVTAFGRPVRRDCGRRCFHATYTPLQTNTSAPEPAADTTSKPSPATTTHAPSSSTLTTDPSDPTQPISERFRALMRLVTQPVVICTSLQPGNPPEPHGLTLSSLTSLSLRPNPLLSFNLLKPSRSLDAIEASGRFNIHILSGSKEGQALADWFAGQNRMQKLFEDTVDRCGCEVVTGRDGVELWGKGVKRVVRCKVERMVEVRDHVIVIGEVEAIEGERPGVSLAYCNRTYMTGT